MMLFFELVFCVGDDLYVVVCVFVDGLCCFILVELLGGVESLVVYLVIMIYVVMMLEVCVYVGISEGLLCLLVGIELFEDFVVDL